MQLPAHACGNTFSGEPDAGKSACPVRRGESGSHRKVSPSLLLYRYFASLRDIDFFANVIAMRTRLLWAMGSYAVLALLAAFTLDGVMRSAVWILVGGLAVKTVIAYKAGW